MSNERIVAPKDPRLLAQKEEFQAALESLAEAVDSTPAAIAQWGRTLRIIEARSWELTNPRIRRAALAVRLRGAKR